MWGLERNRVVEPVSIVPEYQLLVNPVIGQLWQLSSILKSVIALCAQSLTNMVSSLKPSYTATLDVLTFDRRNGFSGSGEDSGWLRYLKRCFHALPFSLSAVFRLFTNSLLSPFYHSSVLTVSLAQARIKINEHLHFRVLLSFCSCMTEDLLKVFPTLSVIYTSVKSLLLNAYFP